jgi:hypothetical protein
MANASLLIKVLVDAAQAQSGMTKAAGSVGKFQSGLDKLVKPAAAVGTAVAGIAAIAVKSASDTQQAMGGLDAVFGSNSAVVKGWANDAATTLGLSAAGYATFAAQVGAQLKNMGVPMDQVAGQTDGLIKLGADLAATYGGTTTDAVTALSAALRGEADPAERYGLALNTTAVNAKMAADGTDKLTGSAKTQAKAQAILSMATEQAGGAVGQFARESDSAAGAAQIAEAQWTNAASALGTALLPAAAQAATVLATMAGFMQQHATATQILLGVVGGLAAAILILSAGMKAYAIVSAAVAAVQSFLAGSYTATAIGVYALTAAEKIAAVATKVWAAGQWLLNVALSANPIGIVILAIVALVAIIIIAWNKSETFRAVVLALWEAIKVGAAWAVAAFKTVVAAIVLAAQAVARFFVAAWNTAKTVVATVIAIVKGHINSVIAVVTRVATAIKGAFTTAWNAIKGTAAAAAAWVKAKWSAISGPIVAVINRIKAAFSSAWSTIKSAASSAAAFVKSKFAAIAAPIIAVANKIKSAFTTAISRIKSAASGLTSALTAPFRAIAGAINNAIGAVNRLISRLRAIHVPNIKIPHIGKSASTATAPTLRTTASPSLRATPSARASTAGAGAVTINVSGALDPEAVARQIERVLGSARRRRAGVVLGQRAAGPAAA